MFLILKAGCIAFQYRL